MNIIGKIKELEDDLRVWQNFEGGGIVERKEKEIAELKDQLNYHTKWIEILETLDEFKENLALRQENHLDVQESIDYETFFKSELLKIFLDSKVIYSKQGVWEYISQENIRKCIAHQDEKLRFIKACFNDNGIEIQGPTSIVSGSFDDFTYFDIRQKGTSIPAVSETEKLTAKLKLTLLYKLGIIDHLRSFNALNRNDRALSKLLHLLLEIGNKNTFQTYLSAEYSAEKSSAPQNNPLSSKLVEKAESILRSHGITDEELKKFY